MDFLRNTMCKNMYQYLVGGNKSCHSIAYIAALSIYGPQRSLHCVEPNIYLDACALGTYRTPSNAHTSCAGDMRQTQQTYPADKELECRLHARHVRHHLRGRGCGDVQQRLERNLALSVKVGVGHGLLVSSIGGEG